MPVTCCGVALNLKVRMLMTAKRARKSPKTEMIWAYQRRRIMGTRRTSPMDNGAGSSGSITGGAVCEAGAGLGEVVLMGDISMLREAGGRRSVKSRDFCGSVYKTSSVREARFSDIEDRPIT